MHQNSFVCIGKLWNKQARKNTSPLRPGNRCSQYNYRLKIAYSKTRSGSTDLLGMHNREYKPREEFLLYRFGETRDTFMSADPTVNLAHNHINKKSPFQHPFGTKKKWRFVYLEKNVWLEKCDTTIKHT